MSPPSKRLVPSCAQSNRWMSFRQCNVVMAHVRAVHVVTWSPSAHNAIMRWITSDCFCVRACRTFATLIVLLRNVVTVNSRLHAAAHADRALRTMLTWMAKEAATKKQQTGEETSSQIYVLTTTPLHTQPSSLHSLCDAAKGFSIRVHFACCTRLDAPTHVPATLLDAVAATTARCCSVQSLSPGTLTQLACPRVPAGGSCTHSGYQHAPCKSTMFRKHPSVCRLCYLPERGHHCHVRRAAPTAAASAGGFVQHASASMARLPRAGHEHACRAAVQLPLGTGHLSF
jgi:hypothetical protein